MMQGYDPEQAVPAIAKSMRAYGVRASGEALTSFIRRATQAHFDYMVEAGVLTEDGFMGSGEYDEDDAFEAMMEALTDQESDQAMDEAAQSHLAQMLDAFMEGQQAFLEASGLCE